MVKRKAKCPHCGHIAGVPLLLDKADDMQPNMACTHCRHQWHDCSLSSRTSGDGVQEDDGDDGSDGGDGGGDGGE